MMNNLGVYIHIPFCVKKCDYCDFLSAPSDKNTMESYVNALKKEIEFSRELMAEYLIDTVFIGGGTPSILEESLMSSIISTLKANCNMAENVEMTIECNPGTVTEEKFLGYREAGINRLSIGLQSAEDEELKSIGRIHTYAEFLSSYDIARRCGFGNINVDLMSALPGQSEASYKNTLEKIIALNPEHISAYSLIVEDGTKLKERVENAKSKGRNILPDEEEERRMYYLTNLLLAGNGYERYEISNYAKAEFVCRHNIGYWKRKDYLGFGIGAASLYKEKRYSNVCDIHTYIKNMTKADSLDGIWKNKGVKESLREIRENSQQLSKKEQMEEYMFLGLRMTEGISLQLFEEKFGERFQNIYGVISEKLMNQELLERNKEYIRLTERGIDISNYVMSEFLF